MKSKTFTFKKGKASVKIGAIAYLTCPHCKKTIIMGEPETNKFLTKWAKLIKGRTNKT